MTHLIRSLIVSTSIAVGACATSEPGQGDDSSTTADQGSNDSSGNGNFDPDEVVERAMAYADDFIRINAESRDSQHGLADTVDIWVAPAIADLYRSLDPDATGPLVEFPDGAMIVKAHLDASGTAAGYTLMAKGDPESPSDGWWWARIDASGVLKENGDVAFCVGCHESVADEGWVYGVPLDNRL
ncbi:MAG: cytochrome P460 family protein [Deltaproteobacteria bacterium]|nr:cytochrome P460 family protein [Nannocystaceae bacterium]